MWTRPLRRWTDPDDGHLTTFTRPSGKMVESVRIFGVDGLVLFGCFGFCFLASVCLALVECAVARCIDGCFLY